MSEIIAKDLLLKDGSRMDVVHICGGDCEYSQELKKFYSPWGREWRQYIYDAADGKYKGACEDHFFLGYVEGRAIGGMWFAGSPRNRLAVVTFGHVYTAAEARGRGISSMMMGQVCAFFSERIGGQAIYLATGWDGIARKIYEKMNFEALSKNSIIMRWIVREGISGNDFEKKYFEPGHAVSMRDAEIGDCGNYEALFNSTDVPLIVDYGGKYFRNSGFESGYLGYFNTNQYPVLKMLETVDRHTVVGAALIRRLPGKWLEHICELEFCVNFSYWEKTEGFLCSTIGAFSSDAKVLRCVSSGQEDPRNPVLEKLGFKIVASEPGVVSEPESGKIYDLNIWNLKR